MGKVVTLYNSLSTFVEGCKTDFDSYEEKDKALSEQTEYYKSTSIKTIKE